MHRLARPTFTFDNGPINIDRVYGRVSEEQVIHTTDTFPMVRHKSLNVTESMTILSK